VSLSAVLPRQQGNKYTLDYILPNEKMTRQRKPGVHAKEVNDDEGNPQISQITQKIREHLPDSIPFEDLRGGDNLRFCWRTLADTV